ncbi:MAG TPA: DUF5818 domain-containing protein [Vicinamibacterales bacterium]|jgi:hypothetical protein|nr:DUF5818 domain-containing protein [Vicinamibacterales bacterium]
MRRVLAAALLAAVTLGAGGTDQTFIGVISDSVCALSHGSMRMGPTDAECAQACVEEHDATFVLVDEKAVYKLSDQRAPKPFAGKKVKVVGTLDAATKTITVTSITGA